MNVSIIRASHKYANARITLLKILTHLMAGCWERADLLALFCVVFYYVFVTFTGYQIGDSLQLMHRKMREQRFLNQMGHILLLAVGKGLTSGLS